MRILSTGMVSPVGLTADAACAAMRCRISSFQELPYVHSRGETVVGAAVPDAEYDFEDDRRLRHILIAAIRDCLANWRSSLSGVPLILGLAESGRPGGCADQADVLLADVINSGPAELDPARSRAITTGHSACFDGLPLVRELLRESTTSTCLLCGVDSYINPDSLRWLDEDDRLKTVDNSNGVIPGECAAAVLLGADNVRGTAPHLAVVGFGSRFESVGVRSDEPFRGEGLAEAARAALRAAGLELHEVAFRISDVTGEAYGFKEQALVVSRLMRKRRVDFPIWHGAECVGDVGAAAGALQLVMAQHAFAKSYAPGASAICFTSSVPGNRAVAVVGAV